MPDVASYPSEKNCRVTAFEPTHHRHFGNGITLAIIFAQKQCVNPSGISADDHILIVVRKNLRLNEVAWTKQICDSACLAHSAKGAFSKTIGTIEIGTLELLASQR